VASGLFFGPGKMKRHLFAAAVGSAFASGVGAMPSGWQTTHGTVNHSLASSTSMQITVTTPNAATSYSGGFSIAAPESVNITQVSNASVFLIRDISGNRTDILGSLKANGHIFLSNANGVLFGRGAQVEVGSLFATSLTMSDDEFRSGLGTGRFTWSRDGSAGAVVNEGTITALNGYAALAGPQVRNTGLIVASLGTAALAAGDRISLDMVGDGLIKVSVDQAALNASAINSGTIEANGGRVLLTARSANALLDTVISNSGTIRATRLAERNGEIVLDTGGTGMADISGVLEADVVRLDAGGGPVTPTDPITGPGEISLPPGGLTPITMNTEAAVTLEAAGSGLVVATLGTVSIAEMAQIVALETQPAGQARVPGGQIVLSNGTTIGRIESMQHTIVGTGVSAPRDATLLP
jgi:filamentous hemagglutinin family protein